MEKNESGLVKLARARIAELAVLIKAATDNMRDNAVRPNRRSKRMILPPFTHD